MELLYGTTNPAKIEHIEEVVADLDLKIISLNDMSVEIGPIDESGNNPLENARIKAFAYYKAVKMPVFSCDSGLYIDGLNPDEQPGVHVRRVNGKILTDEEMIEHYSNLALKLGGEAVARYRNAICLVLDEETVIEYDGDEITSEDFLIASKAHVERNPGFPLNSLSKEIKTGEYYMDLQSSSTQEKESKMTKGLRKFFRTYCNGVVSS